MGPNHEIYVDNGSTASFEAYGTISCGFEVRERVDVDTLESSGGSGVDCFPIDAYWKDYDLDVAERPVSLPSTFDVSRWVVVTLTVDTRLTGGTILGVESNGFEFPGLNEDSVVVVDIRVSPPYRGLGIGIALLSHAVRISREMGKKFILVETQDINTAACRLYSRLGFRVESCEPRGYGPDVDEATADLEARSIVVPLRFTC